MDVFIVTCRGVVIGENCYTSREAATLAAARCGRGYEVQRLHPVGLDVVQRWVENDKQG